MKKQSSRAKLRRKKIVRAYRFLFGICLLLIIVLLVMLFSRHVTNRDTSLAYALSQAAEASEYSDFALQKTEGFTENLVVPDSKDQNSAMTLQYENSKALLFNLDSQEVLYTQGVHDKIYPASVTKLMTGIICLENSSMNETVVMQASDFALEENAQASNLRTGDQVSMEELFKMLMVFSANDAAIAIARTVGGTVQEFVDMMNEKALELGMTGTHFTNPHGLHEEDHYTTAYDVYLLMNEARNYPKMLEVSQIGKYEAVATHADGTVYSFMLYATDEYLTGLRTLPKDVEILASKTGTTSQAGACLALLVQDSYGVPYIAVVMNAMTHDTLYEDMTTLLRLI